MRAIERLEEIEKLCIPSGNPTSRYFDNSDKKWLIERVKKLTEALEFYADGDDYKNKPIVEVDLYGRSLPFGSVARKALQEDE